MNHLTTEQLRELKEALRQEKNELEKHFESGEPTVDLDQSLKVSTGELSSYDNHPADVGTETFERSRDLAVDDNLNHRFEQIRQALERIGNSEYGKCVVCGKDIPFERLQAVPYTAFCMEHTPERNVLDYRPVEEELITPPPAGAGESRQRSAGKFDDADAWHTLEKFGNSDSPAMAAKRNATDYDNLTADED